MPSLLAEGEKAGTTCGWHGELGDFITLPTLPRQDTVFHQARGTEGTLWGMGGYCA